MTILVRNEAGRNSRGSGCVAERGANTANQSFPAAKPRQQEASRRDRTLGTQGLQAFDDLANQGIDRNQAFGFELAEGHVNGPLIRPQDRKSTRLNSSHLGISYAVFC